MSNRKRVLFVCLGNACRSQMAEAFARAHGSDVMIPASAGLAPALRLPNDTLRAMDEKKLDLRSQFPKSLAQFSRAEFDLIINMSGFPIPSEPGTPTQEWDVPDPIGLEYQEHCEIRDQIETLVMGLISGLRQQRQAHRLS